MPTFTCHTCDAGFQWPWKRQNCPTCWTTAGGSGKDPTKTCTLCAKGFRSRWERDACYDCRPARGKVDLAPFRERGFLPLEVGTCRVCGEDAPGATYCGQRCRQRAHYMRYDGLTAADWRELHGIPTPPGVSRRPRC